MLTSLLLDIFIFFTGLLLEILNKIELGIKIHGH
jgi:hypothetical protein